MNDEDLFLKDYTKVSIFHVSKAHLELVSQMFTIGKKKPDY